MERGYKIAGMVLTGAACEADLAKSGLLDLIRRGSLNAVIAYSSHDDTVLPGPVRQPPRERKGLGRVVFFFKSAFRKFYSALASPYGSLGRTGLLLDGSPLSGLDTVELRPATLQTRWYRGGHSTYFTPANIEHTFRQILRDISASSNPCLSVTTYREAFVLSGAPDLWRTWEVTGPG